MKKTYTNQFLTTQTKIVFIFIGILTIALVLKTAVTRSSSLALSDVETANLKKFKSELSEHCIQEENLAMKAQGEITVEDQEWLALKAPVYCQCVSEGVLIQIQGTSVFSDWISAAKTNTDSFALDLLKAERSKGVIERCLSKIQKLEASSSAVVGNIEQ